jgi:hypothetical protein
MELAQQAEVDPKSGAGRYGALQIATAPAPMSTGAPNLRVATLHIPASPSTLAEVADTFVAGAWRLLGPDSLVCVCVGFWGLRVPCNPLPNG